MFAKKKPVPKDQTLQVGLSSMWEPGLVHVYLGIDQDYLFALPIFWQFLGHDCMYVCIYIYIYVCVCVCVFFQTYMQFYIVVFADTPTSQPSL